MLIDSTAVVQKTRYISDMCRRLTLFECKLVDCYLSRINSRDPSSRVVEMTMRELEEMWNIADLKPVEVRKNIEHLLSRSILVKGDVRAKEEVTQTCFFAEAKSFKDDRGRWVIRLSCTEEALPYIFNIESVGYIRYELKDVMGFRSKYTYLMFLYLLRNAFRRDWSVSIEKLQANLACTDVVRYKEFKFFNNEVLKKVYQDILGAKDSPIVYQYTLQKSGRSYSDIEFKVIRLFGQPARKASEEKKRMSEDPLLLLKTATMNTVSETDLKIISDMLSRHGMTEKEKQVNYIHSLIERMSEQPSIKYRARYLKRMVENDCLEGSLPLA